MATDNIRRTTLTGELRRIMRTTKDPLDKHYLARAIKTVEALTVEMQLPDVVELERMYLLEDTRD